MYRRFLLIAFLSGLLAACGRTVHWKQEVLLQDGRVIVVDRESEQTGKIFPENISMEKSQSIEFENPDTNEKISWDIPKGLLPYTLDFDNKTSYLVLVAYTVADYNNWNCPNPPYLVYRHGQAGWESIPFDQLPARFEKRNLIDMSKMYQKYASSETASLKDFQKFLRKREPSDRIIGREKINSNAEGCLPSTLEKLGRSDEITEKFYRKGDSK